VRYPIGIQALPPAFTHCASPARRVRNSFELRSRNAQPRSFVAMGGNFAGDVSKQVLVP